MQCLLQAIRYGKSTERLLVVDWRDSDWTHSPDHPLSHFLEIEDVPTFGLKEFNTFVNYYGEHLSIVPESWRFKLTMESSRGFAYKPLFQHGDNSVINEIAEFKRPDFPKDIVVYPGNGHRTFSYSDLNHIKLSKWVTDKIVKFA